ncbi:hypothetical protein PL9631_440030 [Planktothrix paucivesiculata PCC 9631]|uniref:Uncharacterized protein n=1 Tax=Planktothrix paucivesiculata PCC 9631 TaxID=671071 RepID=A0A7Z9BS73_9CYAN|nr:hypothetical protein PL9631_440030 [Planktothrix paucivesiculata PCC 9631]
MNSVLIYPNLSEFIGIYRNFMTRKLRNVTKHSIAFNKTIW